MCVYVQKRVFYLSNLYSTALWSYQKCFTIFTCVVFHSCMRRSKLPPRSTSWGVCRWPDSCFLCVNLGKQHIVSAFALSHIPTLPTIKLKSGRSMVVGACTSAFLWVGEKSHHLDFHHASRGWQDWNLGPSTLQASASTIKPHHIWNSY